MSDYTQQPPPSTGTLQPASVNQGGPNLPATGSDVAPLVGVGLIAAVVGGWLIGYGRRARRNPWAAQERRRTRDFDQLARDARKKGATEYRFSDGQRDPGDWKPLP